MSRLQQEKERWQEETLRPTLEKYPERREDFETSSGIPVQRLYLPRPDDDYLERLGFPGEYPFTRGVHPTMYRGRLWTMRQYAGFGTAEESNERYKYLLSQGQTGLSVAFDLPTQIGYDADDPMAMGEVGRAGVSITSLQDMIRLLDGIPLDEVSISMTINAPAAILLAMVIAVAKRQGVRTNQLRGTVQNDILKEYIARGTYIFPPQPSMRLITDVFGYCSREAPHWNTISVSGYHIREAGSTAAQEVAFTLANGITYVQAALEAGLDVDRFADQISFFFNAHNNFLEEVAKFRAARRVWARIMRQRFGATDLPDDNEVGSHRQRHLHQITQADLTGAVEGGRSCFVVGAVNQRDMEFPHLLTGAYAMVYRDRTHQGGEKRRLACSRWTRDDHRCIGPHRRGKKVCRRGGERIEGDERVQGLPTKGIATDSGGETIGNRRNHNTQTGRSVEDPGLSHRIGSVQSTVCSGDELFDGLTILEFSTRGRRRPQNTSGLEVGDLVTLNENLFDIVAFEQVAQRAAPHHRPHQTLHGGLGVGKRPTVTKVGPLLVLVDSLLEQGAYRSRLLVGIESPPIETGQRLPPQRLVDVGRHDRLLTITSAIAATARS